MTFYTELMDQDRISEGLDYPRPSYAKTMIDLYALQTMSPEARLAKSQRLEAVFARFDAEWAADSKISEARG